jgi:hypothetical protein
MRTVSKPVTAAIKVDVSSLDPCLVPLDRTFVRRPHDSLRDCPVDVEDVDVIAELNGGGCTIQQ